LALKKEGGHQGKWRYQKRHFTDREGSPQESGTPFQPARLKKRGKKVIWTRRASEKRTGRPGKGETSTGVGFHDESAVSVTGKVEGDLNGGPLTEEV